jgi:Fe-S-cluster containining protein
MAAHMGLPLDEFMRCYTRLTDDRAGLSLVERIDGACIFLSATGECAVQCVKPQQCRDFPIRWSYPGFEVICRAMKKDTNERK